MSALPITMFIGFLFLVGAFMLFAIPLFSSGGANRSTQINVMGAVLRGDHGTGKRSAMRASFIVGAIGAMLCFVGVAQNDRARAARCATWCSDKGYAESRIGASLKPKSERKKPRRPACICGASGKESIEVSVDDLPR